MQGSSDPFIDGDFFVYPDGRRLARVRGAEEDPDPKGDPKPDPAPDPKPDPTPDPKPPWGDDKDFDPNRAWKLIQGIRDDLGKVKTENEDLRGKVKKHEDASKSDQQKLEERATTAETRATAAEMTALRIDVALDKAPEGMSVAQVRKLAKRLSGDTKEELEADAEELFAEFASNDGGDGQEPSRRPKERLRPGAAPGAEPEETDPKKLAASVPRSW